MAWNSCDGISVRRSEPELVVAAKATRSEVKHLSDIDDHEGLRMHLSFIMFYKREEAMKEFDPVMIIKRGISEALVHYYPLAGRVAEGPNRKLVVECSGEGVMFVEAQADVALEELGDSIGPPCLHRKHFLYQLPASQGILASPLLFFQVTRLSCGGFVFAVCMNHVVCDSFGLVQFLNTVATMARDPHAAIQQPVWRRDIFSARNPPRVTCTHHEFEDVVHHSTTTTSSSHEDLSHESFLFGKKEIETLRNHLPQNLQKCSTVELLTACLWKCRTMALDLDPNEVVGVSSFVTTHGKVDVPKGYYGNAFVFPMALSKAGLLCENSLGYALGLIREAKGRMSEEYVRSMVDLMVLKGRPMYRTHGSFFVGDMTRVGFDEVDFGWGKPVYGGPVGAIPLSSYLARFKNGIMVPILLPQLVMKRFLRELTKMTSEEEFNLSPDIKTRPRSMI
ncbi:methanol O-anthraniloyltransferase [Vigna radiata var. radiata]|uniref:Methanol O-anthraniloyltransferase n=1 Tax=Vigna radiata var. radiata TaxID=3916 RepID=A0A1S3VQF2_VIGRR|nr:methanol O-anthraniloyltransferase [Vigna radiata var. radiata]